MHQWVQDINRYKSVEDFLTTGTQATTSCPIMYGLTIVTLMLVKETYSGKLFGLLLHYFKIALT